MKKLMLFLLLYCSITSLQAQQKTNMPPKSIDTLQTPPTDTLRTKLMAMSSQQQAGSAPNIIPRSPEAELYMRYGEIPVSLSTGIPEISVPIYTIKLGELELPINISYHASGNKPDDVASAVGLGWVLNTGGMITQTVNGQEDFSYQTKFEFQSAKEAYAEKDKSKAEDLGLFIGLYKPYWRALLDPERYKTVSDRFSFNFGGYNGVFRMDIETGEYKTIPHTPMQITQKDRDHIVIVDPKGNTWTFKRYEAVKGANDSDGANYEYHVAKMKPASSTEEINFYYTIGARYSLVNRRYKETAYYQPSWQFDEPTPLYCGFSLSASPFIQVDGAKGQGLHIAPVLINKIEWGNSSIIFNYKKDRVDPKMKDRLDNILIKSGNTEIKTILYNKDRYLGTASTYQWMLLDSIKVNAELYSFKYNKEIVLPTYSTNIHDCFIDFWGYYNGKHSNWVPFKHMFIYPSGMELEYLSGREVNPKYSQFGIIKEIQYPTKGRTEFCFENNKGKAVFSNNFGPQKDKDGQNYFGGLRIKSIKNYDGTNLLNTKTYEYEGYPIMSINKSHYYRRKQFIDRVTFPHLNSDYIERGLLYQIENLYPSGICFFSNWCNITSSSSFRPITNPYGQSYYYDKIIEYNGTETNNAGKTEYHFTGARYNGYESFEYVECSEPCLLTSKKVFENDNGYYKAVQETQNTYNTIAAKTFIAGVLVEDNDLIYMYEMKAPDTPLTGFYVNIFFLRDYYYNSIKFTDVKAVCSQKLLAQSDETLYTDNGAFTTTSKYTYDSKLRTLSPIKIEKSTSNNNFISEQIKYPFDYSTGIYFDMSKRNMVDYPIEAISSKGANEQSRTRTNFSLTNGLILPQSVQKSHTGAGGYFTALTYDHYDNRGNLLQYTGRDGVPVSFAWGYNGQYPVAKVVGAAFQEIKTALGESYDELRGIQSLTGDGLKTKLNQIRTHLNTTGKAGLNAQVSTYTYKPLIGMDSETDPNGISSTYEYDAFGRLIRILDNEGKVLKQFEYNYKK